MPFRAFLLFIVGASVGLTFLSCGLWALFRRPNAMTRLNAFLGLAAIIGLGVPIYLHPPTPRFLLSVAFAVCGTFMLPLLLEIALRFPDRPTPSSRTRWAIYGPIGLVLLMLITLPVLSTRAASWGPILGSTVVALYALAIVLTVPIRWLRSTTRAERRSVGGLVAGFVLGLTPLIVSVVSPDLPGASYYFLSIFAVPVSIARGLTR